MLQQFGAGQGGIGYGQAQGPDQQYGGQYLQQHPLLQAVLQHPVLSQQFLQVHPLLQQALQDPQAAAQLVQQHPILQQALQHPLLARQIMQQYPMLHQVLQQRLMQQMQQIQQQGVGGYLGIGQLTGQPYGTDPYSAWMQQQGIAAQYRGMQPGQMMGQGGGQTLH
jgi:hypothetical protein